MKFTTMRFEEFGCGSLTDVVGRKDLFKDKQDFLNYVLSDKCAELEKERSSNNEIPKLTIEDVKEDYVRYYPNFPEGMSMEVKSGWTYCDKNSGAFEVYSISLL